MSLTGQVGYTGITLEVLQIRFRISKLLRDNINTFVNEFCCLLGNLVFIVIRIAVVHFQQLVDEILSALQAGVLQRYYSH